MNTSIIIKELKFKAIRSSGSGGQHVNKVSSKIELTFDILSSKGINEKQKSLVIKKLNSRITNSGILILQCGETRSQHRNKEIIIQRFLDLLKASLKIHKTRKTSRPSKASVKKRLEEKKYQALKKSNRKKPLF